MKEPLHFAVFIPTHYRSGLLARCLDSLRQQTYRRWVALVAHDGPCPRFRQRVKDLTRQDPRILPFCTKRWIGDHGWSPRAFLARRLHTLVPVPDYVVFWDDDNFVSRDALRNIAAGLARSARPDVLIAPITYRGKRLPPPHATADGLRLKQIDSLNLVVKAALVRRLLPDLVRESRRAYDLDFRFFEALRLGRHEIVMANEMTSIGCYDGHRRYVRWARHSQLALEAGFWMVGLRRHFPGRILLILGGKSRVVLRHSSEIGRLLAQLGGRSAALQRLSAIGGFPGWPVPGRHYLSRAPESGSRHSRP